MDSHSPHDSLLVSRLEQYSREAGEVTQLLQRASSRLSRLDTNFPFFLHLRNNLLQIMYFLVAGQREESLLFHQRNLKQLCRGALFAFVESKPKQTTSPDIRNYDDTEIADFVVKRLAEYDKAIRPGKQPILGERERQEAENRLIELAGQDSRRPEWVASFALSQADKLNAFDTLPFIADLVQGVRRLASLLQGLLKQTGLNKRAYPYRITLGALAYFNAEDDLLPARYGLIGYLDDAFVVKLALELLERHGGLPGKG